MKITTAALGRRLRLCFFEFHHWRVRSKLVAVVLIPTVAFAVLAQVSITSSMGHAQALDTAARLAKTARQVTGLIHELQLERDLTAGRLAQGAGAKRDATPTPLVNQRQATDQNTTAWSEATGEVSGDLTGEPRRKLNAGRAALDGLPALRRAVDAATLTSVAVFDGYSRIITRLNDLNLEIAQRGVSEDLARSVRTFTALSWVKEQSSQVRGTLYAVAYQRGFGIGGFQDFADLRARRKAALEAFRTNATDQRRALYADVVKSPAVLTVAGIQQAAVSRQASTSLGIDPEQWLAATTTEIELIGNVETALLGQIIDQSNTLRSANQRRTVAGGIVIAAILALALLASLMVARSMARHLRRLRATALDVAENRLPDAIQRLRANPKDADEVAVEPVAAESGTVSARDEIGDVARAFHAVHSEAIRLATEQAMLRRNVNGMFVNLARRSQVLVERQLRLIDRLEGHEEDPDQLQNLFKLDHLATRMRRNDESLLVLAGSEAPRSWPEAIALSQMLRAAGSEVEYYTRIRLAHVSDVSIVGHAVADIVHMLAELLENATTFSPPTSTVVVTGRVVRGGTAVLVEIEDVGVGMTPSALAEANRHLAEAPLSEISISARMGLFVVSRLAARHNITVRLRESPHAGVVASVTLPTALMATGGQIGPSAADAWLVDTELVDTELVIPELAPKLAPELTPGWVPALDSGTTVDALTNGHPVGESVNESVDESLDESLDESVDMPAFGAVSTWFLDTRRGDQEALKGAESARRARRMADGWALAWQSAADEGWTRAVKADQPELTELTAAGLPIRVPQAHYVPGSAGGLAPLGALEHQPLEADEVRTTLSRLYEGVEQAREQQSDHSGDQRNEYPRGDEMPAGSPQPVDDWKNT